jgi:hypothetical protein
VNKNASPVSIAIASLTLTSLSLAAAGCGDTETNKDPNDDTRALPGVVLIDNGEDGNNSTMDDESAGYFGYWYTFDDKLECSNPAKTGMTVPLPDPQGGPEFTWTNYVSAGQTPPPEEIPGQTNEFGARFSGGGHAEWGAGLGVALNNQGALQPYDLVAQGFTALRFWIKNVESADALTIDAQITDAFAEPDAGRCIERDNTTCEPTQGCSDAALFQIPNVGAEWQPVEIPLEQFMRGGWGNPMLDGMDAPTGLATTEAYQIQFKVGAVDAFDIWIDNVGFVVAP